MINLIKLADEAKARREQWSMYLLRRVVERGFERRRHTQQKERIVSSLVAGSRANPKHRRCWMADTALRVLSVCSCFDQRVVVLSRRADTMSADTSHVPFQPQADSVLPPAGCAAVVAPPLLRRDCVEGIP